MLSTSWNSGYTHVVWDWNGTLLDDAWLSAKITNQMLGERDLPGLGVADYRRQFGFPLDEYCRQIGFDLESESFDQLSDCFIREYERRRLECDLHVHSRSVLEALQQLPVKQLVLSAYRQETLDELISHFELRRYLAQAIGVDNDRGEGKVALGLRWIATANVLPESVLLIGDTLHDHEVAVAMGVDCILVAHGHQSPERLQATGSQVFEDLAALSRALKLPIGNTR